MKTDLFIFGINLKYWRIYKKYNSILILKIKTLISDLQISPIIILMGKEDYLMGFIIVEIKNSKIKSKTYPYKNKLNFDLETRLQI